MTTKSLWEFSLRTYAQPGVSKLCLRLQDDYGVDVNLLLWSLWLEQRGQVLTLELLTLAQTEVAEWKALAVMPLRQLRRQLKQRYGTQESGREAVRTAIKMAELRAEEEQQRLLQLLSAAPLGQGLCAGSNGRVYLASCGVGQPLIDDWLACSATSL